jgi:hypothetical protein
VASPPVARAASGQAAALPSRPINSRTLRRVVNDVLEVEMRAMRGPHASVRPQRHFVPQGHQSYFQKGIYLNKVNRPR